MRCFLGCVGGEQPMDMDRVSSRGTSSASSIHGESAHLRHGAVREIDERKAPSDDLQVASEDGPPQKIGNTPRKGKRSPSSFGRVKETYCGRYGARSLADLRKNGFRSELGVGCSPSLLGWPCWSAPNAPGCASSRRTWAQGEGVFDAPLDELTPNG